MKFFRPSVVLIFSCFICVGLRAQIISDIHHELFRDKILLTYTVNGLASNQQMEVNLYCSDDSFKHGLKSVDGNGAGTNVSGNGQKTIIWDVLKDRKELVGKISFELRALVTEKKENISRNSGSEALPATMEERKTALYAEMSGTLGDFIIKAKDLVDAFKKVGANIYEDNLSLRKLTDAVINYNVAFTRLNTDRMSYEKNVLTYWGNEALYNDVRYLFDYALGELHTINVLELNGSLNTINDINLGKISGRKNEREAKDKVMASIVQNTGQLEKRVQELERRANRILYTLSNR
jgi:hypothetical protein